MASYTGGSTVTLTNGELNNSTIADITKTGADAYASVLTLKTAATANDLLVSAGGTAFISSGGVVNNLTENGTTQKANVQVRNGGVVNGANLVAGTLEFWVSNGGRVNDLTVNDANAYIILSQGATVVGGSVIKCAIFQVQTGAVVSNYTFLKTADAGRYNLAGGTLIDCAVGAGGIYRVSGAGITERLTVSGANARFLVSGGTMNDPLVSGGMMYLYKGTVNRATVVSGAVAGNTERGYFYGSGGTVNDITFASRGSGAFVSTTINNLYISQGDGATYPTVVLYSGAVVSGGSTSATVELYVSSGAVVKDFTVNPDAYIYVVSGATISGGVISGRRFQMINGTVREAQFGMTNSTDATNRMSAGLLDSCTVVAGGIYGMKGGRAVDMTVSGANARFFVSGGELSGATVIDGGRLNVSGGTVTGIVESGGYVYIKDGVNATFAETTLENFTFTGSATVHAATTANDATIVSGGNLYVVDTTVSNTTVNSGGVLTVCASSGTVMTHGVADGVTINEGGQLLVQEGQWAWGFDNWGVASNVTVESGGTITMRNFTHLLDVTAVSGAVLDRASNRVGIGGANTNIAKGVITGNGFGEDFEVVNGVATGLYLTGDQSTPRSAGDFDSGLTIKDAQIVSGASAYLYTGVTIDGIDVYGKGGASGATLANLWIGGATGGGVRIGSGGSAYASSTDMHLDDIVVESGGTMDMYRGVIDDFVLSGGTVTLRGGTVDKMAVVSGTEVGNGELYISAGATVNELTVSAKGSALVRGGTVKDVLVKGGNGTPRFIISQGGVVEGGKTSNTVEFWFQGAGTATNVTFNTNAYLHLHAGGKVIGGTFNGARLSIKGGGIAENLTILKSDESSEPTSHGLFDGLMSNCTIAENGVFRISGGTATGTVIGGANARFNVYGGTVSDTTVGKGGHLSILGGTVSATKAVSGGEVRVSGGTVNDLRLSGGVYGSATVSGAVTSTLLSATTATIYNGATVSGALIEDYAVIDVSKGGTLCDATLRMNSASVIKNKYARININGGLVSGGSIAGNGNTIEFYMNNQGAAAEGVASDVTFDRGTYIATYSNTVVSGGTFKAGTISMRGGTVRGTVLSGGAAEFQATGGTIEGVTVCGTGVVKANNTKAVVRNATFVSGGVMSVGNLAQEVSGNVVSEGGSVIVSHDAIITGTIIRDGGFVQLVSGATVTDTTVSSGGYLQAAGSAKQGVINGLTVLSGGKLLLTANSASVAGLNAEDGAVISLSFTNATAATAAAFDTLANCDATIELLNVGTTTKTFNVATTGNAEQQFAMLGSGVFEGVFKAGDVYVDPFTQQQLTVAVDATTIDVVKYVRTTTDEAATFATSGATINGGDKELMWNGATVTGAVKLIDTDAAAAITGDAWLDICACSAGTGAAIYGTDVNVNFDGKVQYQLHAGGAVGNFAAGANYGGSVKGVDILTYNTTYTGVGYAGGFGTVQNEVEVVFAGGNTLNKDFYAGALYNAGKVAASTTTSVGSIKATIGEKSTDTISVKGNFYGASAVKAGTVTTVENQAAFHTVGDVELTLRAGAATKSDICVFAGGYATGHDTAKLAAVYTVASVTATITGGTWGGAHGGRGVFGGAFASDNVAAGDEAAGVCAKVGNVNLTISGGTMGNVYGGGWAQKGARSEVENVNITVTGGTIANIFGGGSTSASQDSSTGSTVTGDVTITVSGGTISGAIFAKGQSATDSVASATVVFTGKKAFGCDVYGYSYVGGTEASNAALSFGGYTGTFSGSIGGFDGITLKDGTNMTIALGEGESVSNTAWKFDAAERDLGLTDTAFLNWTAADFADDTITLNLATGDANEWSLVTAAATTAYNKFDVQIDGTSILSETIGLDQQIAGTGTAYDGWGFTNDNGTLKFAKLA